MELKMKGDVELSSQLVIGIVIAIITIFLFYVLFPRSACDAEAELSSIEIKKAIECAAGVGTPGCSKTATVKMCQEDGWSVTGGGFIQSYYGLMVPEYLIYYQKFPIIPVTETGFGMGMVTNIPGFTKWSDSYPFERATIGERQWDTAVFHRPTLTEFKQFYRTKYLEQGCTDDTGICINKRGREDVLKINLPSDVADVRLFRPATMISEEHPKFHLVAPCFAKVNFEKYNDQILAFIMKGDAGGASNYCYADAGLIFGATQLYAAENACRAADVALSIVSLGTKDAAKRGAAKGVSKFAKQLSKTAQKEIQEEAMKAALKSGSKNVEATASVYAARTAARRLGAELTPQAERLLVQEATESTTKTFWGKVIAKGGTKKFLEYKGVPVSQKNLIDMFFLPCVNLGDLCRGAFACAETLYWPGLPFAELTSEKMKKWNNKEVMLEIFGGCCEEYVYGSERDPANVSCDSPPDIVDLVKIDLGIAGDRDLVMKNITDKLGLSKAKIDTECGAIYSDTYRTCRSADEVRQTAGRLCTGLDAHTYTLKNPVQGRVLQIFVRTAEDECQTTLKISYNNSATWKPIDENRKSVSFPDGNSLVLNLGSASTITQVKIEDKEKKCHLDYSSIAIDPPTETATETQMDTFYTIEPGSYKYFIAPEGFQGKASDFCGPTLKSCLAVQKQVPRSSNWIKFFKDTRKTDFAITGGEQVGFLTTTKEYIKFAATP